MHTVYISLFVAMCSIDMGLCSFMLAFQLNGNRTQQCHCRLNRELKDAKEIQPTPKPQVWWMLPSNDNLPTSGMSLQPCPLKCHIDQIKNNKQNYSNINFKVRHFQQNKEISRQIESERSHKQHRVDCRTSSTILIYMLVIVPKNKNQAKNIFQ